MQQVWIYIDEGDSHHGHSVVSQVFAYSNPIQVLKPPA